MLDKREKHSGEEGRGRDGGWREDVDDDALGSNPFLEIVRHSDRGR